MLFALGCTLWECLRVRMTEEPVRRQEVFLFCTSRACEGSQSPLPQPADKTLEYGEIDAACTSVHVRLYLFIYLFSWGFLYCLCPRFFSLQPSFEEVLLDLSFSLSCRSAYWLTSRLKAFLIKEPWTDRFHQNHGNVGTWWGGECVGLGVEPNLRLCGGCGLRCVHWGFVVLGVPTKLHSAFS